MCGLVSVISKNPLKYKSIFLRLKKINKHRGPDKINLLTKKNQITLFRRLSIIDLQKRSHQPFVNDNGNIHLVFNGEIYNFVELRKTLSKKKIKFYTNSDTEVIMRSYEFWGINFVKKLRGMFSIVLFDERKNKVFFIKDPLGQKPLYYFILNKDLIVSSEIKDILYILKNKKIRIKENKQTVFKYLYRGWANDDNCTFFENINEFPAASISCFYKNKLGKPKKYWKLKSLNKKFNDKNFLKEFNYNTNIHLRSDVPIAMTLSSGLDSSSLVQTAINLKKNKKIKTFSLKLQSNMNDESKLIKKFVKFNKLDHEFINVEKFYNKNLLQKIITYQDEPLVSPSHINQFILRNEIKKKKFKVLVVGEGGDEVLGGDERNVLCALLENNQNKKITKIIINNAKKFFNLSSSELRNKLNQMKKLKTKKNDIEDMSSLNFLNSKIKIPKKLNFYNPSLSKKKIKLKDTLKNHIFLRDLPYIIRAEDKISMGNSIENRTPFIDHKFIEYVFSHKSTYLCKDAIPKFMLRKSMEKILPKFYLSGKKIGRPMNLIYFFKKFHINEFKKLLVKSEINFFDNKKIYYQFDQDFKRNNFKNFNFYFRVLNYLIWKKKFNI